MVFLLIVGQEIAVYCKLELSLYFLIQNLFCLSTTSDYTADLTSFKYSSAQAIRSHEVFILESRVSFCKLELMFLVYFRGKLHTVRSAAIYFHCFSLCVRVCVILRTA